MKEDFPNHDVEIHKCKQYAYRVGKKLVATNTVEGYFSILKRGVHGVYHHESHEHLHRYLAEFDFRYNARDVNDAERASAVLDGAGGRRLMYRDSSLRS